MLKKGGGLFFEEKSISGAILGSAKIFTFLASFNAEKKSVGLFEKKSPLVGQKLEISF